ncbi:hypothetical protein LUZ60_008061 [Juncus effusus]|nr:hypothetical protein LUZ60_008061 [Juncus effusus]
MMATQVSVWNGPDWSFLPAELIQLISEKIVFKEQYDQFRSVCQQWRRACPPHACRRIGQCPWILLAREKSSSIVSFCDFPRDKIYKSNLPDVVGKRTIACSRGWILLEKGLELSLINPITGELKRNCLPSLAAPPTILEFARNEKTKDPSQLSYRSYSSKIILTSSPSHVSCCIVVAQFRSLWESGFVELVINLGLY